VITSNDDHLFFPETNICANHCNTIQYNDNDNGGFLLLASCGVVFFLCACLFPRQGCLSPATVRNTISFSSPILCLEWSYKLPFPFLYGIQTLKSRLTQRVWKREGSDCHAMPCHARRWYKKQLVAHACEPYHSSSATARLSICKASSMMTVRSFVRPSIK